MNYFFRRWRATVLPALALCLSTLTHALPTGSSVPGGIALVTLGPVSSSISPPRAWLGEQPVWVTAENGQWMAVVGLALDLPAGTHELHINDSGQEKKITFSVGTKRYPEQRITLKDSSKVTLSAVDEERVVAEIGQIQALKHHWRETDHRAETDIHFLLPASGRLASRFGLRRFFNGEPRAPHTGLDVAIPRGTPIKASSHGQVLATGDYFFNGKTVFIDHGNGVLSMYCHLDQIDVQPGNLVTQGQRIGRSGMTGRASGPHLHWSVVLNGVMVDPALFLKP